MQDYQIKVVSRDDREYVHDCIDIAMENNIKNGGTLYHYDLVEYSKYIICVFEKEKMLGYAGVMEGIAMPNDLHINTLAIAKSHQRQGIGSIILDYIIHHSLGYDAITSNARHYNKSSINLHLKLGFKQEEGKEGNFNYTILTKDVTNNQRLCYTEDEKEFE